ncbi:MAG: acyltransferase [Luteolibacter sp.]
MKAYLQKEPDPGVFEENCSTQFQPEPPVPLLRQFYRKAMGRVKDRARLWCLEHSGSQGFGRVAAWLACRKTQPYHFRAHLAEMTPRGFVAPSASLSHPDLRFGKNVYVGDRVVITQCNGGRAIELKDRVHLYGDSFVSAGSGAAISIGAGTHIQPGCHIYAHISNILIGERVEIAANCGFFSYDHDVVLGRLIMDQPLKSTGDIVIGDGAWLGFGVTVLQGVRIGDGAVVGAGSVVSRDIPDNAIAAGIPAKVIRFRTPEKS